MTRFLLALAFLFAAASVSAEIRRIEIPAGIYGDARPDGARVMLVRDSHFETHLGRVPLPDNINVFFVRVPPIGDFKFAGQDHTGRGNLEWRPSDGWRLIGDSYGTSPVIYDWNGTLHQGAPRFGAQGFRYVSFDGRVWTGDETYQHPTLPAFWEYSCYRDYCIGQGEEGCIAVKGNDRRMLERGFCVFARVTPDLNSDEVAITYIMLHKGYGVHLWLNAATDFEKFPPERTVVEKPEEVCGNGIDDDSDGLIDELPCPPPVEPGCPDSDGIRDGIVVNPQDFFGTLYCNKDASMHPIVIRQLAPQIWKYGFGFQTHSDGTPRGRIYLPTAQCPNAAPRPGEEKLGVRQEEVCWEGKGHAVDTVNGALWTWVDRGGPAYQPFKPGGTVEPDPTVPALKKRIAELEADLAAAKNSVRDLQAALDGRNQRIRDLESERDGLKADLDAKRARVTELEAELEKARNVRCESDRPWLVRRLGISVPCRIVAQ